MSPAATTRLPEIIKRREQDLLERWTKEQLSAVSSRRELLSESQLREQSREFLALVAQAAGKGNLSSVDAPAWQGVRDMLSDLSRSRAAQGFSPSETATFVFSLKQPLFDVLRQEYDGQAATLTDELWTASAALDQLGLYTTEVYQKGREEVILRQQQEMLELSTPVVKLWDGVLALPMIGTLDSARTQVVMESLLQRIVETGAEVAIIDITGVPTVDTLVAQHLLKTVTAARLMGAECIISGIRPQIAQTIVHLGVDLSAVITKATLADAFQRGAEPARPDRAARARAALIRSRRHGADSDPQDGRLPAGHHPGGHARPARDGPAGRPDRADRRSTGARGVLIDISALEIVDSFIGRMIGNIAGMARVLDAQTVRGRHAAGRGHHAGGAGPLAAGRPDGAQRGARAWHCSGGGRGRPPGRAGDGRWRRSAD